MNVRFIFLCWFLLLSCLTVFAQKTGRKYKVDRYSSIYLPLGRISFADSIVAFRLGDPPPIASLQDATQCLHEPNYKNYHTPNFLSLGCKGSITVAFTDNGFMNLKGNDLYIFEVGPSREAALVEISENGIDWIEAGTIAGGKSSIDLSDAGISSETVFYFLRITDLEELCRSKSAGADIDAIAAINSVIRLTINADVLFDVAKFELKESAEITLKKLAELIQQVDKATILIEGHTDNDGSDDYNVKLSQDRCEAVLAKLQSLFPENAMYDYDIRSYGESKPRVENSSEVNKQINRRVEITVLPPNDYYDSIED
ncbi:MAG: OmpA family protein [Flavobacteriales bacterium]|jgi:OOP family OmpA-OmpF porin|uniref:OmpA family protein n=1 Tax=Candidatus Ulvibacter alkanivorans TaxID=2267620 RepID=UPI000DF28098|nr:OmpA family protein [Candidatus Ulvibacter alkanivorans]MCH2491131.1 OmpA family protein [Flavobacteriales bacterium]